MHCYYQLQIRYLVAYIHLNRTKNYLHRTATYSKSINLEELCIPIAVFLGLTFSPKRDNRTSFECSLCLKKKPEEKNQYKRSSISHLHMNKWWDRKSDWHFPLSSNWTWITQPLCKIKQKKITLKT